MTAAETSDVGSPSIKGIIMAGGNGTRLNPLTKTINKHLLPVYDKPMIYYPLTTLMLAGIRNIAVITRGQDKSKFEELLGTGEQLGISIEYLVQDSASGIPEGLILAEEFISESQVCLILGDNILIGQGLGRTLSRFINLTGAQIFAFPVSNPEEYGVVEISDMDGTPIRITEKPSNPKSNLAIPGIYFLDQTSVIKAKSLKKSPRGELEITDLLKMYLSDNSLKIEILQRGTGWMDAGTIQNLYGAAEMIKVIQERQGLRIGMPEEVALNNGWITHQQVIEITKGMSHTDYSKYLMKICQD